MLKFEDIKNKVFTGDSKEVLREFPSNSVDLVVTSPPYYNLRNYQHEKQIGKEKTPEEYIDNLISIFKECTRVLKNTGSIWINIADSYNNRKTLYQIPERLSIAIADRINLFKRNTIIWHKPSCMPSSAKDRFTIDFEYFYWYTKDPEHYYFDTQYEPMKFESLLREGRGIGNNTKYNGNKEGANPSQGLHRPRLNLNKQQISNSVFNYTGIAQKDYKGNGVQDPSATKKRILESLKKRKFGGNKYPSNQDSVTNRTYSGNGWIPNENLERIKRTVWSINTPNSTEAHFATYPEELIEIPIKACTDDEKYNLVLDPFLGSGTTAIKAQKLGRNYVGIELNPKYVSIAKKRLMYMISSYIPRE